MTEERHEQEPSPAHVTGDPVPDDDAVAAAALRRMTRSTPRKKTGPRRVQAAFSDGRDPQTVGAAVERLIRDQGWQDQSAVALLMTEWDQIVGVDVAEHVRPVSFEDGQLELRAESTAWATQVRLLLPQVHRAVDARVGEGVVTRIRITGPQAPTWTAGKRRVAGRGPRDTYG